MHFPLTKIWFQLAITILVAFISTSYTLDMEGVLEGPCVTPPQADMKDLGWLLVEDSPYHTFYMPMASKYSYYRHAELFLNKRMEDITEEELSKACILTKAEATIGFGGKVLVPENIFGDDGVLNWNYKDTPAYGKSYMVLSDGKSYVVAIDFWNDTNQKSWIAVSINKKLTEDSKEKILSHVKNLGFDPTQYREINYDECDVEKYFKDEL